MELNVVEFSVEYAIQMVEGDFRVLLPQYKGLDNCSTVEWRESREFYSIVYQHNEKYINSIRIRAALKLKLCKCAKEFVEKRTN